LGVKRCAGKVLVAMSGGVDSSVAAGLLLRAGYEVVGCFMRLGTPGESLDTMVRDQGECSPARIGKQGCCSINDAADARRVAAELGIPLYVCNFKRDFGRVIEYFAGEYAAGRTPNPCVRCNDWLKFGKLRAYARQIGAEFVASGHYARTRRDERTGETRLLRGVDRNKDQSYVLFGVPREHLAHVLLPIGEMEKPRVRELAREMGLPVFDKPDSQEICFVPDGDYAGLVERLSPGVACEGPIVDGSGRRVGTHGGQHRFTIGQRRGLSLTLGRAVYVVSKDAASNTVVVGDRADLLVSECEAHEANWLTDVPGEERAVLARYRYNSEAVPAVVRVLPDRDGATPSGRRGAFAVAFEEPQYAVAPGQAVVLYDREEPDVVLGGGWIESCVPVRRSSSFFMMNR
jgi:tRNA-specific 2-thiouridylase